MRTKLVLAAVAFTASSISAQAGGLLDAVEEETPAAPVIVADGNQGSMGGSLPWILGGLLIAGAVAGGSSGSGS